MREAMIRWAVGLMLAAAAAVTATCANDQPDAYGDPAFSRTGQAAQTEWETRNPPLIRDENTGHTVPRSAHGGFVAVSAGAYHTCALRVTNTAVCWGRDEYGETSAPTGRFVSVSAGGYHSCGLRPAGQVECWGHDGEGQSTPPTGAFSAISAGAGHTCGVRRSGGIACWGWNASGQASAPDGSYTAVSAGNNHTCGLRTNGRITCWGAADAVPSGDADFNTVNAGWKHTCGMQGGAILCWGSNEFGQNDYPSLFSVRFGAVSAGGGHNCALREDLVFKEHHGRVLCWGYNSAGQASPPDRQFFAISAGGEHTCAVHVAGALVCWGRNNYGQIDAPSP